MSKIEKKQNESLIEETKNLKKTKIKKKKN